MRAKEIANITKAYNLAGKILLEKTLNAYNAAITIIIRSKTGVLAYSAPTILKRRGNINNSACQEIPLTLGPKTGFVPVLLTKSCLQPTKKRINVKPLIVTVKGTTDKGFETPNRGYILFINNPTNIKNAILKPTENKIVSILFLSLSFRPLRMTNPGINVR